MEVWRGGDVGPSRNGGRGCVVGVGEVIRRDTNRPYAVPDIHHVREIYSLSTGSS